MAPRWAPQLRGESQASWLPRESQIVQGEHLLFVDVPQIPSRLGESPKHQEELCVKYESLNMTYVSE
jgi:hypothetical protein